MMYKTLIPFAGVSHYQLQRETDLKDWAILEFISKFEANPRARKRDDKTWINFNHLMNELECLNIRSKSAISARLKKLVNLSLISTYQTGKDDGFRLYIKTNELYKEVVNFFASSVHEKEQGVREKEQGVLQNEHSINNHHQTSIIQKQQTSVVVDTVKNQQPIDYINEPTSEIIIEEKTIETEISPIGAKPESVEFDISELQPIEKKSVEKILSKIEPSAQNAVISVFKSALKKGIVKSPVAYAATLVKKSQNGELEITIEEKEIAPIGANDIKEKRADKICRIFAKHSERIKQQLVIDGHIIIDNETVTKSEFEELGLVEKGTQTISGGRKLSLSELLEIAKQQECEPVQPIRRASKLDNTPHDMSEIVPKPLTEKEISVRQKILELEMQLRENGQWIEPNLVEMA